MVVGQRRQVRQARRVEFAAESHLVRRPPKRLQAQTPEQLFSFPIAPRYSGKLNFRKLLQR
jgi:hypothetical protein